MHSEEDLLRISGVVKTYRTAAEEIHAVRDLSLTAHAREFVCIFGSSGSGKSTLLNLISALDRPDEGRIVVAGQDVADLDGDDASRLRLRTVGVVFQEHRLIDEFTAVENVALPMEALGYSLADARLAALDELDRVGLADVGSRFPGQLSGGQRQRVGIARALVGQRRVLLADEPTGALDTRATLGIFALLRALSDQGTLVVVCSHDARCQDFADSVYEMVDGRLLQQSRPAEASEHVPVAP